MIDEELFWILFGKNETTKMSAASPANTGLTPLLDAANQALNAAPPICPEQTSWFVSKLTFSWLSPLMKKGKDKYLEMTDLWDVRDAEKSNQIAINFKKNWDSQLSSPKGFVRKNFCPFCHFFHSLVLLCFGLCT